MPRFRTAIRLPLALAIRREAVAWRASARVAAGPGVDACATVADTAESSSNSAPVVCATIRASVVLPEPGGP